MRTALLPPRPRVAAPLLLSAVLACGAPDASAPASSSVEQSEPAGALSLASPTLRGAGAALEPGATAFRRGPVDLRADTNRDGVVDVTTDSDEDGEDAWTSRHGAVFLANIDDDESRCPKTGSDEELAACHDAADDVVNGEGDLEDLARIVVLPMASLTARATGTLTVSPAAAPRVRLFKRPSKGGTAFVALGKDATLDAAELGAGVELALEGKDVVRDARVWDGLVDVTLTVTDGGATLGTDTVQLRMAPLVTPSHLDAPEAVYVSRIEWDPEGSQAFRSDVARAAREAGVGTVVELSTSDQWAQDYFEPAYMTMPSRGGVHGMHVMLRSANHSKRRGAGGVAALRPAGKLVFTRLRGKDVGGVVAFDPAHPDRMDTLNSFGNYETIPPYTLGEKAYPLGRMFRGRTSTYYPDPVFTTMMESQGVQPPVYVDTSWLLVGHVDEVVSFVPAANARGWTIAAADPRGGKALLERLRSQGRGGDRVFVGKANLDRAGRELPAEATIDEILDDEDVLSASNTAAVRIDRILTILKEETGVTDAEILRIPFLFTKSYGGAVAYQPGMVNGVSLGPRVFGMPKPHGPRVGSVDMVESAVEETFGKSGLSIVWIEDWDVYHRQDGEVHCGSNTRRAFSRQGFWTFER